MPIEQRKWRTALASGLTDPLPLVPTGMRTTGSRKQSRTFLLTAPLVFYFLDFKFSNFVCLSEVHPLIWFFKKILQEKEKYPKNHPKRLSS